MRGVPVATMIYSKNWGPIAGYLLWFALLVQIVVSVGTGHIHADLAASAGFYLGIAAGVLGLSSIPYVILKLISTSKGRPAFPWTTYMLWTTVIALLLTMGGMAGRLYTLETSRQPISGDGTNHPPLPEFTPAASATVVESWEAMQTRFLSHPDNSFIRANPSISSTWESFMQDVVNDAARAGVPISDWELMQAARNRVVLQRHSITVPPPSPSQAAQDAAYTASAARSAGAYLERTPRSRDVIAQEPAEVAIPSNADAFIRAREDRHDGPTSESLNYKRPAE